MATQQYPTDVSRTDTPDNADTNVARLIDDIQVQAVHQIETAGEASLSDLREYARGHTRFNQNPTWSVRLLDVMVVDPQEHMATADAHSFEARLKEAAASALVEYALDNVATARGPVSDSLRA